MIKADYGCKQQLVLGSITQLLYISITGNWECQDKSNEVGNHEF